MTLFFIAYKLVGKISLFSSITVTWYNLSTWYFNSLNSDTSMDTWLVTYRYGNIVITIV